VAVTTWNGDGKDGYDQEGTGVLIDKLLAATYRTYKGKTQKAVKVIYFNDPAFAGKKGVTAISGHDNHLHVRFNIPDRIENESKKGTIQDETLVSNSQNTREANS
jgi:hypothetical protein